MSLSSSVPGIPAIPPTTTTSSPLAAPAPAPRFMLPSAPCSVITRTGRRIECPDGILLADTPELLELALDMLAVGNCIRFEQGDPIPPNLRKPGLEAL